MASYLGRNVNLALLIIIIGVVVALVGTTVFFQRSLQNRTGAYETTTQTLQECRVALANYQDQYAQAQEKVNQTSQDIRKYDQLYEQKTVELKETQATLATTEKQLQFEKLQKEKFQQFYEDAARQAAVLNATVKTQAKRIDDLEDDLAACEDGN
jgi:chromosome segregation ATPase